MEVGGRGATLGADAYLPGGEVGSPLEEIEIRETRRVHEHAAAAIIRARKPVRG